LILGPDGAKLSKRHGNKYGVPIFAMNWTDPVKNEFTEGFRERGFLPEAFINLLALMGWNPGTEQEIFTKEQLIAAFNIDRVHSAGAQFDFEKAKWYNHEWIKKLSAEDLLPRVKEVFEIKGLVVDTDEKLLKVIAMIKDRCILLTDFYEQGSFFYKSPELLDMEAIKPKWNEKKNLFFTELVRTYGLTQFWQLADLEKDFKEIAAVNDLKPGELMLPFRIMLVGGKFGPGVFDIAETIGKATTIARIQYALQKINA
jgi:glutamyl-tRNA synthetase